MGLLDIVLGNASEVDLNELQKEFSEILIPGEQLEKAFAVIRDKWIFTNKRLILQDIQGLTGTKREYMSIPYNNIAYFSIETAGTLDDDCEMKVWLKGATEPIKEEFSKKTNIKELQRALAAHVLG